MTSQEIYKKILLKVNLNDTNGNIRVPKSTCMLLFNEVSEEWLVNKIKITNGTDEINDVDEFLKPDTELTKAGNHSDSTDFILPDDYLEYSRSYSLATKGNCKNRVIVNWDIKNKNINTILTNSNESPSFEYEETPIKISNGNIKVYKSDFEINSVFLDYYKIPTKIDIEGYIHFDGTPSKNIDADFSNKNVNQVITETAVLIMKNQQNVEGLQIVKAAL